MTNIIIDKDGLDFLRALLEEHNFGKEVYVEIKHNRLVISKKQHPRQGWEEAFQKTNAGDEELLIPDDTPNQFDEEEWTW